ncbi:MAG: hypothetical protein EXS13_04815 [Planctomycetes bacterium]|nr:hypothetical protein [Planctomycetota bacterium]
MSAFLAVVGDVWREARDKRVVWVLGLLGFGIALFFAGTSVAPADPDAALVSTSRKLGSVTRKQGMFGPTTTASISIELEVGAPRAPLPEDDFPLGIDGMRVVEIRFRDVSDVDQMCRLLRGWRFEVPIAPDERRSAIESRYMAGGFGPVFAREIVADDDGESAGGGTRWRIGAGVERPLELVGGARASFFFGATSTTLDRTSPAELLALVQAGVADQLAGFFGLIMLISAFASALPDLLAKGSFDLVLARPVGRVRLVLYKYVAAVLFVLLFWLLLFGACAVALRCATGFGGFALVRCALPCTLIFAALYPAALLVGALTRHATLATLGALGVWSTAGGVDTFRELAAQGQLPIGPRWLAVLDGVHHVLPKCGELKALNQWALASEHLSQETMQRMFGGVAATAGEFDSWYVGGTTAVFAAVLVALTAWFVQRRDW